MTRANRHFIPGCTWHITQRCHKKEFLLKFPTDRKRWLHWLFEAKKRYNLHILDYAITSNHVHLLVFDHDQGNAIPHSMHLISGRTGQEYNQRKDRKGAFWEDRYHAVAVDGYEYLLRCIIYIDLNMVRAGVVKHPAEWKHCGYNEIQQIPKRKRILNYSKLLELLNCDSIEELQKLHREKLQEAIEKGNIKYDEKWTKSIAIGSFEFIEKLKKDLKLKIKNQHIVKEKNFYVLKEDRIHYLRNKDF